MSLLPHNATQLERALEAAADLGLDPDIIRGVADSARCPPNFLPWLAWAWKVEGWEAAYTDEQRRALIREPAPLLNTLLLSSERDPCWHFKGRAMTFDQAMQIARQQGTVI